MNFSISTANLGGLLGLFMGFSVISIVEVFYFISIRPYCNYLRNLNERRELTKLIRRLDELRRKGNFTMANNATKLDQHNYF